ncbi:HSP20-like chaperone [Truncatella angustata]|uniref:HSP20-like chaperone n=1 Tax=Truncatella angustata TaxID=152316 RepID=A0A9P8RGL2_9PEZI|nr:HSP20-like chaperone [Truncatella angustata]KAH6645638.1 HSP20-like chaperone [Truncatella angustata]
MAFVYVYPPERYSTTSVSQTFPEAHWPLEHTRHKIGQAFHEFVHPYEVHIYSPHTDIRETAKNYYVDIEFPGLADKKDILLKWTSSRTLIVEARIKRPEINEEGVAQLEDSQTDTASKEPQQKDHLIHYLIRERGLGAFARAFSFNVDVQHDKFDATLKYGLLRLILAKPENEQNEPKEVPIKHEDSEEVDA